MILLTRPSLSLRKLRRCLSECYVRISVAAILASLVHVQSIAIPSSGADTQILKVVTSDTNFPYNFVKAQKVQGLSIDVAQELAQRLGMKLEVQVLPWTRALYTAQTQAAVMVFTVAKIPEREKNYYWIGPVTHSEEWLYKLKHRKDIKVQTMKDAQNYLVGDEASNASIPVFNRLGIKVDTAPSMQSNCKKFKVGRVDLIPFDPDGVEVFANECGIKLDDIEKTVQVPRDTALYFAFGKSTSPEFIRRVEAAFTSMVKDKSLQRLSKPWKADVSKK